MKLPVGGNDDNRSRFIETVEFVPHSNRRSGVIPCHPFLPNLVPRLGFDTGHNSFVRPEEEQISLGHRSWDIRGFLANFVRYGWGLPHLFPWTNRDHVIPTAAGTGGPQDQITSQNRGTNGSHRENGI